MTENPRVAILVLNYNGANCLPRCLASLKTLTYPEYKVWVIDNGSQDQSLNDAQKEFPENKYLAKDVNTGFAAGMNTGIRAALLEGYDFVWLMNYDAEVFPDTVTKLIEAHHNNRNLQAMSPVIKNEQDKIWFAGGKINYWRMRVEHEQAIKEEVPYQTSFLTGCAPLFSKEVFQKVGLFDERFFLYYEDADFSCRIRKSGIPLFIVPGAVVVHAEKSQTNPQKLYYLVHYGLLFFALHTPRSFRLYIVLYVTIRRLVNQIKLLFGLFGANSVRQAYADYFRKFQAGYNVYLRKLS